MPQQMARGLFITGTDTGVGKTYVTALIARALKSSGHRVGVYKPVASGCEPSDDSLVSDDAFTLWQAAGKPGSLEEVCPQRFRAPLAPHLAARAEDRSVDAALLRSGLDVWLASSDIVLVEGVGGLMSPVSDDDYVADLACEFGFPLLVISRDALGTIHQTLTTLITAATIEAGLNVAGIILNELPSSAGDPSIARNRAELEARAVAPVLAKVGPHAEEFAEQVDWFELARARATR
ncbi:MAG TPA: dethiobiotin synthase [Pirellulales bacterium]